MDIRSAGEERMGWTHLLALQADDCRLRTLIQMNPPDYSRYLKMIFDCPTRPVVSQQRQA
jgi:hypothetical protein